MGYNVPLYFKRNQITPDTIQYLTREAHHTIIALFDGWRATTVTPIKEILQYLPEEDFLSVSKGVVLRKDQIVHISDEGVYTMTDGSTFQGRKRSLKQHKLVRQALELLVSTQNDGYQPPMGLLEKCSLMDEMPVAFCVIELVFDANGHGVDFLFRYCNKQMEVVEGVPAEAMVGHSFYEVFSNGDKKWLVVYADVALNGSKRTIQDLSPEVDKTLTIYCYQPAPGHCACILIPGEG